MSGLADLAEALRDHTPWKPMSQVVSDIGRLERARRAGRSLAQSLGHVLGEWELDTAESFITACLVCEELAAVDVSRSQPTEYVGRALRVPGPGPYAVR